MIHTYYSTIKGEHKDLNQDSIGVYETNRYVLSVVGDGLGSKKHSNFGSKTAIKSVRKALTEWLKLKQNNTKILFKLIHFYWNLFINDLGIDNKDCLTTCLFIYIDKISKKFILGQLGDGVIYIKYHDKIFKTTDICDFNYTQALGNAKNINDWQIYEDYIDLMEFKYLIVTDGIASDIQENKEEEFLNYLINLTKKEKRNFALKNIMKNWSTKFHNDDKTISIGWGDNE